MKQRNRNNPVFRATPNLRASLMVAATLQRCSTAGRQGLEPAFLLATKFACASETPKPICRAHRGFSADKEARDDKTLPLQGDSQG
jgi:hypothetical protein